VLSADGTVHDWALQSLFWATAANTSPARTAKISERLWAIADIVDPIEAHEAA